MAEKIIQNPSITSGSFTIDDGKIVAIAGMPLAGSGGGTQSDFVYVPSFNDETGDISFILGVTGTEGKGPWHISGTPGPKGEDGAQGEPGNDACPITATSAKVDDGVHVTISYTSGGNALTEFDILDGYDGNDGKTPEFSANPVNAHLLWKYSGDSNWTDFGFAMSGEKGPQGETGPRGLSGADGKEGPAGYSPQVTTASVNNDATHNNGGTEINITYKDDDSILTAKYTAWNGNNGEGATIALNGKDGIAISNNGSNYYAGLSADYLAAVQSVSSKLTKTSADTLYQPIGTYALKSEIPTKVTDLTDSANYVVTGDILTAANNTLTGIKIGSTDYTVPTTDLSNYYTKSETSATGELNTEFAKKLDKTTYATDSATFVTSSNSTITGTQQYALTTTGWTSVETAYLPTSGGTVSGATYFSAANGQNVLAVASAATLIGASRQTSGHFGQDQQALGTTWMGVGGPGMYRGFFKYTQDGDVGALNSQNMMQIEFTPSNKGQIFAKATNNGTAQPETQILNPVKSTVDSMATSANANGISGPNYLLAKNADGQFVIGAAVINCINDLPGTLSANTYYFVY